MFFFDMCYYLYIKNTMNNDIKLNEKELETVVRLVLRENMFDEGLPIRQYRENIQVNFSELEKIVQDINRATFYFEGKKPKNDPEYSDKLNRLKRGLKSLNKLINS